MGKMTKIAPTLPPSGASDASDPSGFWQACTPVLQGRDCKIGVQTRSSFVPRFPAHCTTTTTATTTTTTTTTTYYLLLLRLSAAMQEAKVLLLLLLRLLLLRRRLLLLLLLLRLLQRRRPVRPLRAHYEDGDGSSRESPNKPYYYRYCYSCGYGYCNCCYCCCRCCCRCCYCDLLLLRLLLFSSTAHLRCRRFLFGRLHICSSCSTLSLGLKTGGWKEHLQKQSGFVTGAGPGLFLGKQQTLKFERKEGGQVERNEDPGRER